MKKLSASSLVALFAGLPIAVYAHPDSHSHYGLISFLKHFFSEPDHLFIAGVLLVILLCSQSAVRHHLERYVSRHHPRKK